MIYDVVIVGAGVTGSMTARELTKYKLSVCILEKADDAVCRKLQGEFRNSTRRL